MPYAIDDEAFRKRHTFDISSRDGMPTGLPIKSIPFSEFPLVVYKHPAEPFRKIEHRNAHYEVVGVETLPAEHLSRSVSSDDELKTALAEGFVREPYIAKPLPDPNVGLYTAPSAKKAGR